VDVALVATTAQAATGSAFVTVTPDGENAIVVAPGANAALTAADVEAAGVFISSAAVLVVQLEVPIAAVERAAELAGPATTVLLNAAPISVLPASLLSRVGVLVLNEHEAAALLDQPAGGVAGASEEAAALLARGPRAVVVTMGPDGAVAAEAGSCIHVPAPAVRVVDTTGAGDAFVGAMAASLAAGATLVDAVTAGVALGSTVVGRPGAQGLRPAPDVGGASSSGAGLTASEACES
jgi:ribokinase